LRAGAEPFETMLALVAAHALLPALGALAAPAQRWAERLAEQNAEQSAEQKSELRVLVLGGSLGAQALNDLVPQALSKLCYESQTDTLRVVHQTGKEDVASVSART